jgi:hypothetical protein
MMRLVFGACGCPKCSPKSEDENRKGPDWSMWESNPLAHGALQFKPAGNDPVGNSSRLPSGLTRGFLFGEQVYEGRSEVEAMRAVEDAWKRTEGGAV